MKRKSFAKCNESERDKHGMISYMWNLINAYIRSKAQGDRELTGGYQRQSEVEAGEMGGFFFF